MDSNDTLAVQAVLDALNLGERGTVPPMAMALASDEQLVAIAAAAPDAPLTDIVSTVCGPVDGATFAAMFDARADMLELLERAKAFAPQVLNTRLSVAELMELAAGSFQYLKDLSVTDEDAACEAVMLWDPQILAEEFMLAAAGENLVELLAKTTLTVDEQIAIAGLLILEPRHPFAKSASLAISEPWRTAAAFLGDAADAIV